MMVMMTIHVIDHKVTMPIPGDYEASEQLMVVVFSSPLAEGSFKKGNFVFELVSRKFPPGHKRRMDIIENLGSCFSSPPSTYQS